MSSQNNQERIEFTQIASEVDNNLLQADILREAGLQRLQTVLSAKLTGQNRELDRLRNRLGEDHPRVRALSSRMEIERSLIREAAINIKRSQIEKPTINENTWVLHGKVYSQELNGIPNLTVGLYDSKGKLLESFDAVKTDKTGYFRLEHAFDEQKSSESYEKTIKTDVVNVPDKIFIHLLDEQGTFYTGRRPLIPEPGKIAFREILLGDETEASMQPKTRPKNVRERVPRRPSPRE